jgi:transposase
MGRPVSVIELTPEQQRLLKRVAHKTDSPRDALRARIVLRRADGAKEADIAHQLGVSLTTVSTWSNRFELEGVLGLKDRPGRGRKSSLPKDTIQQVVTGVGPPPDGKEKWTTRSMAAAVGVSRQTVQRIWKDNNVKPHISPPRQFLQKFWDVIGLYLNPPANALAFCCGKESEFWRPRRPLPGLPVGTGHIHTHDYKRHRTFGLLAAVKYLGEKIHSRTEPRHAHIEWLRFLKRLDRETPAHQEIHVIVDTDAANEHETVQRWLTRHRRVFIHEPTPDISWTDRLEHFFDNEGTEDNALKGSFASVRELTEAIHEFLLVRKHQPQLYVWCTQKKAIWRKIKNSKAALRRVTTG